MAGPFAGIVYTRPPASSERASPPYSQERALVLAASSGGLTVQFRQGNDVRRVRIGSGPALASSEGGLGRVRWDRALRRAECPLTYMSRWKPHRFLPRNGNIFALRPMSVTVSVIARAVKQTSLRVGLEDLPLKPSALRFGILRWSLALLHPNDEGGLNSPPCLLYRCRTGGGGR